MKPAKEWAALGASSEPFEALLPGVDRNIGLEEFVRMVQADALDEAVKACAIIGAYYATEVSMKLWVPAIDCGQSILKLKEQL